MRIIRHRCSGQTFSIAAVAMVAMVGALAMVIDAGIFFVIQRRLQTAADSAALAGAWYDPVCPYPTGGGPEPCEGPRSAVDVATEVAQQNADQLRPLCGGSITVDPPQTGTPLNRPQNVNWLVVTVKCTAGYSFGQILGLRTVLISRSAAAAIGDRDPATKDMTDFTLAGVNGRIARLVE